VTVLDVEPRAATADYERALGQALLRAAAAGDAVPLPISGATGPVSGPRPPEIGKAPALRALGQAVPVRPVVDPEELEPSRRRAARTLLWVRNAGLVCLLFLAYQWWGTGFEQHRAQVRLRAGFEKAAAVRTDPAMRAALLPAPPPLPNAAVARLEIPAIGLDQYVIEGTGKDDLRKGPGHYTGSPLPGRPGNAAIAGHRTTYGAPFNRLDELKAGDVVVATTTAGRFRYLVSGSQTVPPTNLAVLADQGDDRLTLTTCTPKFSASHRLVVVARLQGPADPPAPTPAPSRSVRVLGDISPKDPHRRDGGGWEAPGAAAGWGMALVALGLLYRPARRLWPPVGAAAVLAPAWIGALLLFFEQLNRALPANV
jgi:sortase A